VKKLLQCRRAIYSFTAKADELELSKKAKMRLAWFRTALKHNGSISVTCRYYGITRSTFYRWFNAFDPNDPQSLEDRSSAPNKVRKSEVDKSVIARIGVLRKEEPFLSKEKIREILRSEGYPEISSSTIGRIIIRNGFFFGDTPSHIQKRHNALPVTDQDAPELSAIDHSEREEEQGYKRYWGLEGTTFALIGFCIAGAVLLDSQVAYAIEGSSFQVHSNFPNQAAGGPIEGSSFTINDNELTNTEKPLVGSSFQIVNAPLIAAAEEEEEEDVEEEAAVEEEETESGGSSGNRRSHTLSPEPEEEPTLSLPADYEAPPKVPEEELLHAAPPPEKLHATVLPIGEIDTASTDGAATGSKPVGASPEGTPSEMAPSELEEVNVVIEAVKNVSKKATAVLMNTTVLTSTAVLMSTVALIVIVVIRLNLLQILNTFFSRITALRSAQAMRRLIGWMFLLVLLGWILFWSMASAMAATTAPLTHAYNGHLL